MKPLISALMLLTLAGCSTSDQKPTEEILHYQCGTTPLTVTLDRQRQEVSFLFDGQPLTLAQTLSASGARYSNGQYTFWSKGNGAFVERDDKVIVDDCVLTH